MLRCRQACGLPARRGPGTQDPTASTYRHSLGSTTQRGGYFLTLTATAPELVWDEVQPVLAEAVASFGLTAEGPAFEAPSDGGLALSLPELSLPELPSF